MYCKNCGNIISSNDRVCPVCGCAAGEVVTPKKKNQNQTLLILVVIALIMALVVIALLIVYKMSSPQDTVSNTEDKAAVVQTAPPDDVSNHVNGVTPTAVPTSSPGTEMLEGLSSPVRDTPISALPTPTPRPTATPKPTLTPTPTPEPVYYQTYVNREYGFSCAYPAEFRSVTPRGVNAVKTYISADSGAEMTLRAVWNTEDMTLDEAYEDFHKLYGDNIIYHPKGQTWFAATVEWEDRSFYRKLFLKNGMICCMDFEYPTDELDIYGPYIEYIEDHFTTKID